MSYKNIIGICILGSFVLWALADMFADWYELVGWWALIATPISIEALVALWSRVMWLLD